MPLISSARSIERCGGALFLGGSFPSEFDVFSSMPMRIKERITSDSNGTHQDFPAAECLYS